MANPTPASALAAQRWAVRGPLVCAICGKTWEGRTGKKGARYCSPKCRQQQFRNRHR